MSDIGRGQDYCFALPLLPGQANAANALWNELKTEKSRDLDSYLHDLRILRLLVFTQSLPDGEFFVTFLTTNTELKNVYISAEEQGSTMSKYLIERYDKLTGMDFTDSRNLPQLERLRYWEDEERPGLASICSAFAIPIKPGKTDNVRRFFQTILSGEIGDETPIFRYQTVEKMESFLQRRPEGDYLVEYVESAKPIREVMRMGLGSGMPLSDYIRKEFSGFCGLQLPLAPNIRLLFDWRTGEIQQSNTSGMAHIS
jgi:hypothetical protein